MPGDLAPLETARAVAEGLREADPDDPSLAHGSAGLAVAFDRFDQEWPGEGFGELADTHLEFAAQAPGRERMTAGLFTGISGVAWAIAHLAGRAEERQLRFVDGKLDPLLVEYVGQSSWRSAYDLVFGLTGIGVYALERLHAPAGEELLATVVERLAELAIDSEQGVAWHTEPRLLPAWQRQQAPRGYFNLGLAHGVPGAVGLLAAAVANAVAVETARPLLDDTVPWLLAHAGDEGVASWIADGELSDRARTGWCYGDPGVAVALLLAARATGTKEWEERALAIAQRATARGPAEAGVRDTPICHGAAGLAQVFGRIHAATGDPAVGAAAEAWLKRTLGMRELGGEYGGFPAVSVDGEGNSIRNARPGLLTGGAGVALVLVGSQAPGLADWDRFLLLSAPGLP